MPDDPMQMTDMNGLIDAADLDALHEKMAPAKEPEADKHIAGGDEAAWVEPVAKWRDLTNFVVPFLDPSNPWTDVWLKRPIFIDAMENAAKWFVDRGAKCPFVIDDDQIEIRLYPKTKQVIFFVCGLVPNKLTGGQEKKECGVPYMLSREQVGWMKATGRWPAKRPKGSSLH